MSRKQTFRSFLSAKGFPEASTRMPDDKGHYMIGVTKQECIEIPKEESKPFPKFPYKKEQSLEQLREQIVKCQLTIIANNYLPDTEIEPQAEEQDDDALLEFENIEDFLLFKHKMNAVFRKRSKDFGWEVPVTVCKDPLCTNSAAPSFQYCLNHILQDPRFNDQILIKKCSGTLNDKPCPIPCGAGKKFCMYHKKSDE